MYTYNNQDSILKDRARNKVHKSFKTNKKSPLLLSMPANNFYFESKFRENYPNAIIDTVEREQNTYKEGLKSAKAIKTNHINSDIFNYLRNSDKKYDIIWLDMCGKLTLELMNNMIPIVQGKYTNKNALIALTIYAQRECKLSQLREFYNFTDLKQFREILFIKHLKSFAKMNKVKLEFKKLFKYNSDKGSPMHLYILTLKTKNK
jgi:hypothetical protein